MNDRRVQAPEERARGLQRWIALTIGTALLALFIWIVQWNHEALATRAHESGPGSALGTLFQVRPNEDLRGVLWRSELVIRIALVLVLLLWVIGTVCWFLRRLGVPRVLLPLAAVALWFGFETFVVPHFEDELRLANWHIVRDVDHWPAANDPGLGTNSDALRTPWEPDAFAERDLNVIFLGDSFTFGAGVERGEAFCMVARKILDDDIRERTVRAANFGWVSASPLLELRRLRAIGERYGPDLVVTCVDMTDFQDDIKYGQMIDRRGIFGWYERTPFALMLLKNYARPVFEWLQTLGMGGLPTYRYFHSEQPLDRSREAMEVLWSNLLGIQEWCDLHGARHVAVLMPRHYQYNAEECPDNWEGERYTLMGPYSLEPFAWWREKQAAGAPFTMLSLLEAFQQTDVFPTCKVDDPHWNAAGHRVAGEALAKQLEPILRELLAEEIARQAGETAPR